MKANKFLIPLFWLLLGGFIAVFATEKLYKPKVLKHEVCQYDTIIKIQVDTFYVYSKVVKPRLNLRNMPSYCKPERFVIHQLTSGKYIYKLPHGTTHPVIFNSLAEAQKDINERAQESLNRWISTDGLDY